MNILSSSGKKDDKQWNIFEAYFTKGKVQATAITNQRADTTILPEHILESIQKVDYTIQVETLKSARVCKVISGQICATCLRSVDLDLYIKIRHSPSLRLRNASWKITEEEVATVIIGRKVLESIGCRNRLMLEAAFGRHEGDFDIAEKMENDKRGGNRKSRDVAALFGKLLCHISARAEGADVNEELECMEFGDDPQCEIDADLQKRLNEAVLAELSKECVSTLNVLQ